jgi:glycosyltransferase involved in cell wall biosynthesis
VDSYDLFFVSGKEWKLLPRGLAEGRVIQLVPSIQQCDPSHQLYRYFKRPAQRICVSDEVARAVKPLVRGEVTVIANGIPLDLFAPGGECDDNSVLIWGRKQPDLARRLRDALVARGRSVDLLLENVPRREFARRLARCAIAVTLPRETEGFFMPALEAMAAGAAVVCPDATGNRGFCADGETCLMPCRDDLAAHVAAVERLLTDGALAAALRARGCQIAQGFSLEREREAFRNFINKRVLASTPA